MTLSAPKFSEHRLSTAPEKRRQQGISGKQNGPLVKYLERGEFSGTELMLLLPQGCSVLLCLSNGTRLITALISEGTKVQCLDN